MAATRHTPTRLKFLNLLPVGRTATRAGTRKEYDVASRSWKDLPEPAVEALPLVLQDKTFVPDDIVLQDARRSTRAWGAPWRPVLPSHVRDSARPRPGERPSLTAWHMPPSRSPQARPAAHPP